jgi:hypothetical protein
VLNFPNYTLAEKIHWVKTGRDGMGLCRMGDLFTAGVPAELKQEMSLALGNAEKLHCRYNILMADC